MKLRNLLLGLLLYLPLVTAASENIIVDNGLLSARFENVPLPRALQQLSAATGVQFMLDQQLAEKLNASVRNVPVDQAIERLLKQFSHVAYYREAEAAGGQPILHRVKIFRGGAESTAQYQLITANANAPAGGASSATTRHQAASTNTVDAGEAVELLIENSDLQQAGETGNALRAVDAAQQQVALVRHKAIASQQAIQGEIADLRRDIAEGNGDAPALIDDVQTLDRQLTRNKQSSSQEFIARKTQLNKAVLRLENAETPLHALHRSESIRARQLRDRAATSTAPMPSLNNMAALQSDNGRDRRRSRRH